MILIFVRYYLPGYKSGGPVRTIANMVEHLGDDFDFYIITSDRDALDTETYKNISVHKWNKVGKAQVFYLSPERCSLKSLASLIRDTDHDLLYLNSFFDPLFTLYPLLARALKLTSKKPVVLAPRGEFSPGAVELKTWKKKPYLWLIRLCGFYRAITWQASSYHEACDIKRSLGRIAQKIKVAPNLPPLLRSEMQLKSSERKTCSPLQVIFLSRIAKKKNLDYALEILGQVSAPIDFNIYGIIDDEAYWNNCQKKIEKLPPNVRVYYRGHIEHEMVLDVLSNQDLFFLPTRGENYGHVIFEALAAGLPVLISDQTPWRGLEDLGIGWDLPLNFKKDYVVVIENQAKLTATERDEKRIRSKAYAEKTAMDQQSVMRNRNLFRELLKGETE